MTEWADFVIAVYRAVVPIMIVLGLVSLFVELERRQ